MDLRKNNICYGDRIFARVTKNGRTILDFVTEKVADMNELLSAIRKAMTGFRGLVILHIRNYNEGWGMERPVMLYAA